MVEFFNKYKWWILLAVVITVIVILIIYHNKNKVVGTVPSNNSAWQQTASTSSGGGGGLSTSRCQQESTFPLKKGSVGKQVGALQKFINQVPGANKIVVDCSFGDATQAEVFRGINVYQVSKAVYDSYGISKFES